jgi:hypothetical protein
MAGRGIQVKISEPKKEKTPVKESHSSNTNVSVAREPQSVAGDDSKKIRQQAREWGVLGSGQTRSLPAPSLAEGQLCSSIEVRQNHELHRLWG